MLDSWADLGTYILAFLAIYIFKWDVIRPHALAFYIFIFIMVLSYILVFVKFHKLIGLHTYLFKITGYLQGGFIFILFVFGFYPSLYYIAIICGTLACLEEIVIIMILRYPQTNVKGLYWVLKRSLL